MSREVRYFAEAADELAEAADWYQAQETGLSAKFMQAYQSTLEAIERFPFSFPVVRKTVRRAVMQRYPYGVMYLVTDAHIVIVACFHSSRDPAIWQSRV
ncbi:MAG TPA: type II toxin-antitoxin system RelE/ParE family toxin [Rhizomicrobium sp.]|nr:type II toxin-antitoxin system RelE/ParE family toxin [Rhizomicrobium sp.]